MCYSQNNRAMDFDFYCVNVESMCVCVCLEEAKMNKK